jgi:hypothetical protein
MNKSLDPNEVITTLQKRIEIKKQLRKSGELPPSEIKKLTKKKNDLDEKLKSKPLAKI